MTAETKNLAQAFTRASILARSRIGQDVLQLVNQLKDEAPEIADAALEHLGVIAQVMLDGATGKIEPDVARDRAQRRRDALSALRHRVQEQSKQKVVDFLAQVAGESIDILEALGKVAVRGALVAALGPAGAAISGALDASGDMEADPG